MTDTCASANTGDLVLNQPVDARGANKTLTIGSSAFEQTNFKSVYVTCGKSYYNPAAGAFDGNSIAKLYLVASWLGTDTFSNGGKKSFSAKSGALIIMDPLQWVSSATRISGTSISARLTVTVNTWLTLQIAGSSYAVGSTSLRPL